MDLRLRTRPSAAPSKNAAVAAGVALVEVSGELDLHSAPQLRAELGRALENNASPRIVVDLAGVTFLDSTGVGVLVGALKRAREAQGALLICGAQTRVRRVFQITGLIGALPLFDTREAAFATFDDETAADAPAATTTATASAPTANAPTANAPTASAPTASAPTASAPTASAPTANAPTANAPTASAPTANAPTASAPTAQFSGAMISAGEAQ